MMGLPPMQPQQQQRQIDQTLSAADVIPVSPFSVALSNTTTPNTPALPIPTHVLPYSSRTVFKSPSSAIAKTLALDRVKHHLSMGDTFGMYKSSDGEGISSGDNKDHTVLLQMAVDMSSQTDAHTTASSSASVAGAMMARMVKPAVGGLAKPVLDLTSGLIMDMFANHFIKKLYTTIVTEVSPDLGMMLGNALKTRLTNTLADSITYSITTSLNANLVRVIAPAVSAKVQDYVPRRVTPMLNRLLFEKIAKHVKDHLPIITSRALKLSLTHGLTRSITQALVPALTHTVSHHSNSDYYCNHCFQTANKQSCSLCHFSDSTVYYQLYYSAYYADYYSKYYTTYYVHAIRRVDELKHKTYNSPGSTLLPQTQKYIEDSGRALDE